MQNLTQERDPVELSFVVIKHRQWW